jgi:hypothetical protein
MNKFSIGDLVWIPQSTTGFIKYLKPGGCDVFPHYKTKRANYGIVVESLLQDSKKWIKVSFWDETKLDMLFRKENIIKHNLEVYNGKTC